MMFKNKNVDRIICSFVLSLMACGTGLTSAIAQGLPGARKHAFQATDGTIMIADIYAAQGPAAHPCVILLHQLGKTKADMVPLVPSLLAEGFTVVNLDMRGHGLSQHNFSKVTPFTKFSTADWAQLPSDVERVLKNVPTLPKVDPQKLALVGVSIGANACAMAAQSPGVQAVVLLSPGLDFHGLKPAAAMSALHKPALIIAAKDDAYSADSGLKLSNMDKNSSFDLLPAGGHGSQMLASHPALPKQIATWLHKAMH